MPSTKTDPRKRGGDDVAGDCTEDRERERPVGRIFRSQAVERYVRRAEAQAIPRLASPRELVWLWVLVGLLTLACLAAGLCLDSWTSTSASRPHQEAPRALD